MTDEPNPLTLRIKKPGVGELHREVPVCDFCLQMGAVGYYQLPSRRMKLSPVRINGHVVQVHDTDGQWNACNPCHDLIEAGDFEGLIRRVREMNRHDPTVCGTQTRLRELYRKWRALRGSSAFILEPVN